MNFHLNMRNLMMFLMLTLAGFSAAANTPGLPDVVFRKLEGTRKVSIQIHNLQGEATIRILDIQKNSLSEEVIPAGAANASRVFNLESLPEGRYEFVVSTPQKETLQPVDVNAVDILILAAERRVYLMPTVRVGSDYVDVSWFNAQVANLTVRIIDLNGATVFEEEVSNRLKVERRYNTTKLEPGDYQLVVATPFNAVYQPLRIK